MRLIALIGLSTLLTGCAFNPQQAKTSPTNQVATSSEGKGVMAAASERVVPTLPPSIPIRPEFQAVFSENPRLEFAHAAMESEPRDPIWAPGMEGNYRRAFASNTELTKYGIPSAECRSTHCEIQMVAYGAPKMESVQWGNLLGKGLSDAPPATAGIFDGGAPTDFDFGNKVVDGATVLVFHVSFARGQSRK